MEQTSRQPGGSSRRDDFQDEASDPDDSDNQGTPSDDEDVHPLTQEDRSKTAYYNHKTEKQIITTEAKHIYQRHQQELAQQDAEPQSPLARTNTLSSIAEGEHAGRNRSESVASKTTGRNYDNRQRVPGAFVQGSRDMLEGSNAEGLPSRRRLQEPIMSEPDINEGVGLAPSGNTILPEVSAICRNIQEVLKIRSKYISLSLQEPKDDPRNDEQWELYPPPPDPVWYKKRDPPSSSASVSQASASSLSESSHQPTPKPRKAGQNIGADFDVSYFHPLPGADGDKTFKIDHNGVYQVYRSGQTVENQEPIVRVPTLREYYRDKDKFMNYSSDGPSKSYTYRQLDILDSKFNLYKMENGYQEHTDSKMVPHRDFYNVRKVDTHVHHSACMNQKHLLRYMKSKVKKSPNEIVAKRDGTDLTLADVFKRLNITPYDLSIDTLDMHAHSDSFHRFDKFNLKYNPIGESSLREVFLKTNNHIKGKYLAEVTREVISDLEASKYQMVEWRLSIYGRTIDEWDLLAAWVIDNKLVSPNVRWLIQIPRLYSGWKQKSIVDNYEQLLINIFRPLFEVTQDPRSHPKLHIFLYKVVGFDTVDDESKPETRLYRRYPVAKEWNDEQDPPYSYWIYYLYANIASLNNWRKFRGFPTFALRPHCGEAGDPDHLAAAALCCYGINHGITLRKVPFFQYIFYLDQIGIAMSPLSNNALFLTYERNPFPKYFSRGLNVSLSTDDPLQFAFTREPLIEEYSVAAQIYKLTGVDMCELAENSVLQSGFEYALKRHWLGDEFRQWGVAGNDVHKTNVPNIRKAYRERTLEYERDCIGRAAAANLPQDSSSPGLSRNSSVRTPTRNTTMRTSRLPVTHSALEMANVVHAGQEQHRRLGEKPIRSSSMIMGGSASHAQGIEAGSSMFPGVVHERARRKSVRQSSGSEKDSDAGSVVLSRSFTEGGLDGVVKEEPGEEDSD